MQNEEKLEAEQELQLLLESARQAMKNEASSPKSPRTKSRKTTRTSPRHGKMFCYIFIYLYIYCEILLRTVDSVSLLIVNSWPNKP